MIGRLGALILFAAVLASAMGVVYAQHRARGLFVQLQELHEVRDRLNVEWGRLQLEQSTYSTNGRIEQVAREKLDMFIPPADAVVIVRP